MMASFAVISIVVLLLSPAAIAHDGPEEVITTLNVAILRNGPSADLFFRRASEFRAMRDYKHAAADLGYAVRLDGSMEIARLELAKLQLQIAKSTSESVRGSSRLSEPLETLKPLLTSKDFSIRIAALALRGEIHMAEENWSAAIADFSMALEHHSDIQWYLWRAEAQQHTNQHVACLDGLRAANAETQSPVIKAALCDALIETIRQSANSDVTPTALIREATELITWELNTSRLKSAWQIRHAELLLLCGQRRTAELELHAAIDELDARLQTSHPDPALLKDRTHAMKLLIP